MNFIDPDGMQVTDPKDEINQVVSAAGKKQGYEVSVNQETQVTTIHKTSAAYSKDEVSTNSNVNVTLTESVYKIDSEGNLIDASTKTSSISATFEENKDMFGNVERTVGDVSIEETGHSFATTTHNSSQLDEIAKSDLVVSGVSTLLKSPNRDAMFTQDSGLPFLSGHDKFQNNKSNFIQGATALAGRETGGLENFIINNDKKTVMRFQLDQAGEANNKFHKLSKTYSAHRKY